MTTDIVAKAGAAGSVLWAAALKAKVDAERYERAGHLRYGSGGLYEGLLIAWRTHGDGRMREIMSAFGATLVTVAEITGSDVSDDEFMSAFLAMGLLWGGAVPQVDEAMLASWICDRRTSRGLPAMSIESIVDALSSEGTYQ